MNWISSFELLLIHEKVITETGGNKGVLNFGNLKAAVSRPFTAFGDQEVFPSLTAKIAAQIHTISSYHPFVDGNKRTALVAADVCLSLNGHRLAASDDLESFFWSIARGERSVEDIELWVKKQGKPLLPLQQ
ncbi:MAG TPA: type II toxin-antitoxin system death-on-curing family toxin [Paludibacter sp.]|jgi:death on curing protein|nr:MAG: Toxin Doc [Deltaproteobacteria bacterium ADurb.Bin135]HQB28406.1 type II toxin-antitoxin system death-on-curing family toxin [Paludibacter sp.]